jgi:heme exporter protein B
MRVVRALLRKELLLERRVPQLVPSMALFSVVCFVVFHFALQQQSLEGELAAGVLSATTLFAAVIGANRLWVNEHEEGGFDGFLLAPVDRTALLVAKAVSFGLFLALVQVVALPAFAILLLGPGLSIGTIGSVVLVLALADIGIAVIGTLVGALAVQTRARDLLGPLVALPLLVPVVIGTANALAPLFAETGPEPLPGRWLATIGLYDLVFGLLAYAVFDYLLDD